MKHRICGIELNTDNIMTQQEFKDALVQLKALFDDLNAVKSTNVRGFIMKEVFSSLGKVEKTADQMYSLINKADIAIEQILRKIDSADKLHQLQTAWLNKAHQDEIESQELTREDIMNDRALGRLPSLDSEKGNDTELPKEEQDCYTQWLKDSTLQAAVENDTETTPLTLDEIMNGNARSDEASSEEQEETMTVEEFFTEDKEDKSKLKKAKKKVKRLSKKVASSKKAAKKAKKA